MDSPLVSRFNKVLVIGSCGAGKSTFAKRLHDISGLPLVHLDEYYWRPGWKRTPEEQWRGKVKKMLEEKSWIMDGNYRNTMDLRLPVSDLIVFLDYPRWKCFWRAFKRRTSKVRADTIAGCPERMTLSLAKWILWTFPQHNRREIMAWVEECGKKKDLLMLRNDRESEEFLNTCKN